MNLSELNEKCFSTEYIPTSFTYIYKIMAQLMAPDVHPVYLFLKSKLKMEYMLNTKVFKNFIL